MRYQYKWQDRPLAEVPKDNQDNLEATIHRALELGINHVETARGYGSSERQLGLAFKNLGVRREELILQTKVSPTENPQQFERHFEESLDRLGVDCVDLLALHGINDETTLAWSLQPGGCFDVAQKARQAGRCRFIGFSTHGPTDVIMRAIGHGAPETGSGFDYVNLHWYFIFQRNWPAIALAAQRDMGVFIISPTDKGGELFRPPRKLMKLCEPLSPMVFNDLFCLSHSEVSTLSLGAARPSDFDEHLKVLPLLDDARAHLDPIIDQLAVAMAEATGATDPEAIIAGLPRWEDTPNHFNLPIILWLRNIALGWGLTNYAQRRYNLLQNAGHWFAGNKPSALEHIDDAEIIAALGDHPQRHQIPDMLRDGVNRLMGEEQSRLSQKE